MTRCYGDVLLVVLLSVALGASFADEDLQRQILDRHFGFADANGDGTLQLVDYQLIVNRTFKATKYTKYTIEDALSRIAVAAWNAFPKQETSKAEYLASAPGILASAEGEKDVSDLAYQMFDLFNCLGGSNKDDDAMTKGELTIAYRALQIPTDHIQTCLSAIDKNHDSTISRDEYSKAAYGYFTATDKKDGYLYFFGYWVPK